jgi:hypothetical protein
MTESMVTLMAVNDINAYLKTLGTNAELLASINKGIDKSNADAETKTFTRQAIETARIFGEFMDTPSALPAAMAIDAYLNTTQTFLKSG